MTCSWGMPIHACLMLPIKEPTIAILVGVVGACKQSDDSDMSGRFETSEDGVFMPDVDLPSGETGDEPDPVALSTGQCVQIPKPHLYYGYVHQCEGSVGLSYQTKSKSGSYFFSFGPGAENPSLWIDPDSYDLPLVAACWRPVRLRKSEFRAKLPYLNSCLVDTVQQTCHGLPHLLRKAAEESGSSTEKLALKAAAKTAGIPRGRMLP